MWADETPPHVLDVKKAKLGYSHSSHGPASGALHPQAQLLDAPVERHADEGLERLAVFQENARPLDPPCASYFWEVRTLGKGAQLSLQWPRLDLQVAGLIGVAGSGETTSTSNIKDAKDE
ncbi:hypothetical protein [Myxococcus virescens]|uniref:Uncharacterized protein n=1 Tax=Myxococcus virescens TaxID=83456 RepID=A0A511HKK2_9BACT|nr:hypothetical protein [Myxococcus virescens]GEL74103.1 hypothetical protein MVI01_58870 [Myxococcus virescens]SDE91303.1 hypothetical protein SAMN04488504_114172 [Myxococcus virescens]